MPIYVVRTVWNIEVFRSFRVEAPTSGDAAYAVHRMIEDGKYEEEDFSEATSGLYYDHTEAVEEV